MSDVCLVVALAAAFVAGLLVGYALCVSTAERENAWRNRSNR